MLGYQPLENVQSKEYLTAGEVARLLHVSSKTISRWAANDLIPCFVTLGGHRRFHREDVEVIVRRMKKEHDER